MPEKVTHDLYRQRIISSQLFDEFVCNHIKTNKLNLWAPIRKCQLQTRKNTVKHVKLNVYQKVVELKEDRNLFACLRIVAKSRPNINLEKAVGKHEFLVVAKIPLCCRWTDAALSSQEQIDVNHYKSD